MAGRSRTIHHLRLPGRYRQEYRLHLEMCGSATLEELDHYLRTIWLGSGEVLLCAQGLYNSSAMTSIYAWDPDKNAKLSTERRLSFEQIIAEIEMHGVLDDVENPNPAFPRQRVLFVAVDGYAVAVPYVTDGETKFLKTAFHSRRATRIYLGG